MKILFIIQMLISLLIIKTKSDDVAVHQQISEWLNSAEKPEIDDEKRCDLKLNLNLHQISCSDDNSYRFSVGENDEFSRILTPEKSDTKNQNAICLNNDKIHGLRVRKIIGGLKNGKFFGQARFLCGEEEEMITVNRDRIAVRNKDGEISFVSSLNDEGEISSDFCWIFKRKKFTGEKYFVYTRCSGLNRPKTGAAVLIGTLGSDRAVLGRMCQENVLENCCQANLTEFRDGRIGFSECDVEDDNLFKYHMDLGVKRKPGEETAPPPVCQPKNGENLLTWWQNSIDEYGIRDLDPFWMMMTTTPNDVNEAKKSSKMLISDVEKIDGDLFHANFNFLDVTEKVSFNYEGDFEGLVDFSINEKSPCQKCDPKIPPNLLRIRGFMSAGRLNGRVKIERRDGSKTFAGVSAGVLNGPLVTYGKTLLFEPKRARLYREPGFAAFAAFIRDGRVRGKAWVGLVGGGFLYGKPDKGFPGRITGEKTVYFYPGNEALLTGEFKRNFMISARSGIATEVKCENGILRVNSKVEDDSSAKLAFSLANHESFGVKPFVRDPYEEKFVTARKSRIAGGGYGLFAIRDIKPRRVVAFLNAFRFDRIRLRELTLKCAEMQKSPSDCFKHRVMLETEDPVTYDIPDSGDGPDLYNATSAHFANHSFKEFKAVINRIEHPRHGLIPVLKAVKEIKAGEEILVHYNLKGDAAEIDWYQSLKDQV